MIRQAGQAGVSLLHIPSSDGREITPIHGHMAVFRALENGLSVVRQTDSGLSIAADPYGRVLAQLNHFAATDRTMVAQVPVDQVPTAYARGGYLFGWLMLIGFGLMLTWGVAVERDARQGIG